MLSRLRDHSLVDHVSPLERIEAEEVEQVRDLAADRVQVPLLLAGFILQTLVVYASFTGIHRPSQPLDEHWGPAFLIVMRPGLLQGR
jgi:hypothetical protein